MKVEGSYIMCSRNRPKTRFFCLSGWKNACFLSYRENERRSIHQDPPSGCEAEMASGGWLRAGAVPSCSLLIPPHSESALTTVTGSHESPGLSHLSRTTQHCLEMKATPGFGVQQGWGQITSINPSSTPLGKSLAL